MFFQAVQHLELTVSMYMHKDKEYCSKQGFVLLVLQHYGYVTYMNFYHTVTAVI